MPPQRELAGLPPGPEQRRIVLEILRTLPMPVTRKQAADAVTEHLQLSPKQRAVPAPGGSGAFVEFSIGWTCNDLKWAGACEQPRRGLYQLTDEGRTISYEAVEQRHQARMRRLAKKQQQPKNGPEVVDPQFDWQVELHNRLTAITPAAFERLAGKLLEVAGFDEVEVTRTSNDGGIDGFGTYRPSGLISFRTAFQCKRWKNVVGAPEVQTFQGAIMGQCDRGIFITTSHFSDAAKTQANKPGALRVDLIDGEALAELLKQHNLGVHTDLVEIVTIDSEYFDQLEQADQ